MQCGRTCRGDGGVQCGVSGQIEALGVEKSVSWRRQECCGGEIVVIIIELCHQGVDITKHRGGVCCGHCVGGGGVVH